MKTATAEAKVLTFDNRDDWLAARRNGIGASDAATVLGENPYQSPFALYCEKVGVVEPKDLSDNQAVQWGIKLEDVVANHYVQETGRGLMDPGGTDIKTWIHAEHEWMAATPDRIQCNRPDKGDGVLEIKTAGVRQASEWLEGAPLQYQIQVQHQLAVTGLSWGTIAVLIGGQDFRWVDIERDDTFIAAMIEAELVFWSHVQTETPPDVDNSKATAEALHRLYPQDAGTTAKLPVDADDWAESLDELKGEAKSISEKVRAFENHIKMAIGDATFGVTPEGRRFSWKTSERKGYEVKPTTTRTLRRLKNVT